jgi:hypothetical protein
VKHLLLNFSRRAGYSVQDEPTLLHDLATSKKGKRGDGLIYHASHEGKNIIFDVTFTDPQSPSNITIGAHKDITTAFKTRETAKHNKYKHQIARAADTVDFQPLAMTVYGSINNLTKKLISQLADRIAESTGVPKSVITRQFHNEISSIIVKTNGEIVFNHCTPNDKTQSDGTEDPETLFNQQTS